MRYLAIDPGTKRTGLAVGDDVTRIASPLDVIVAPDLEQRLGQIARAIEDQGPDALVLGLPLNMDGSEGEPARRIRVLASQMRSRFGLPVHLADERLSSSTANEQMARTGLTHRGKKRRRDALAAAAILREFLANMDR